jgi:hypothetical protein
VLCGGHINWQDLIRECLEDVIGSIEEDLLPPAIGESARPYRISASVMEEVNSSRLSRLRTQETTCGAGSGRISSETTFVSRLAVTSLVQR